MNFLVRCICYDWDLGSGIWSAQRHFACRANLVEISGLKDLDANFLVDPQQSRSDLALIFTDEQVALMFEHAICRITVRATQAAVQIAARV